MNNGKMKKLLSECLNKEECIDLICLKIEKDVKRYYGLEYSFEELLIDFLCKKSKQICEEQINDTMINSSCDIEQFSEKLKNFKKRDKKMDRIHECIVELSNQYNAGNGENL